MSWKSSKQEMVVDSTIEAEYIASSKAAKEAVWIKKFVSELDVVPSGSSPIVTPELFNFCKFLNLDRTKVEIRPNL